MTAGRASNWEQCSGLVQNDQHEENRNAGTVCKSVPLAAFGERYPYHLSDNLYLDTHCRARLQVEAVGLHVSRFHQSGSARLIVSGQRCLGLGQFAASLQHTLPPLAEASGDVGPSPPGPPDASLEIVPQS